MKGLACHLTRVKILKNMRLITFFSLISIALSYPARAQSLDIGGIELSIGQNVDEALKALSAGYKVQFHKNQWLVTQGTGEELELLGTIAAKDNAISFISKSFIVKNPWDGPEVYTRANKEIRSRGGDSLSMNAKEINGIISEFVTKCGPYYLTYQMPWRVQNAQTNEYHNINTSISISVYSQ